MKITPLLAPFFKRIERYKTSDTIQISANKLGYLKFIIEEEERRIEIQWKDRLEVLRYVDEDEEHPTKEEGEDDDDDVEMMRQMIIKLKLRYWNIGSKLLNISSDIMTLIVHKQGCFLHCFLDSDNTCDISLYLNKISSVEI
ncbi:unnamed protein product [Ambrosiozyma monospora]|uniref:Unnamed protein product n=1 Tax=Ambrosiozyma monospora TaxID=43982 RepID=A0ACB5UCZ3_AMBMO|nr:unnamed protein product [Ambrosiozyma monospora]